MDQKDWAGVFPAITTPFQADLSVDYETFGAQARWLVECGCNGIVALGSLGEAPALTREEKLGLLKQAKRSLDGKAPVIAGISALSTAEAVALAKEAHRAGVDGLMVLPPLVYRGDWRETQAHLSAVFQATPLSAMLYNNPVAYGTDILPEQIIELRAQHQNFHAVKESSGEIRRITSLKHLAGDSLEIFVGMDDVVVESVAAGATGWIAGLVNAFPEESVRLFKLAQAVHRRNWTTLYSLVPAFAAPGYRAQVCATDQAGSGRVRRPFCARKASQA